MNLKTMLDTLLQVDKMQSHGSMTVNSRKKKGIVRFYNYESNKLYYGAIEEMIMQGENSQPYPSRAGKAENKSL